jgi:DNA-binding ferritin-like protein
MEIKDKIAERCQELGELTQEKYEEVVKAVIAEYEAAKKITVDEAKKLEGELQGAYETIRQTIHEHTA